MRAGSPAALSSYDRTGSIDVFLPGAALAFLFPLKIDRSSNGRESDNARFLGFIASTAL